MPKVFVHGNPETSFVWTMLVSELTARGIDDIVLLSPPGFGAPIPDGFACTQAEYRDWLIAEIEGIGEPVDLVGHDWGAGHTVAVAAARPDLLRSWAADCCGLLHPDYEWHANATVWQTPGEGEASVEMLIELPAEVLVAALGITSALAQEIAQHLDADMGEAILRLYRSAVQPAMRELGDQLAAADRRPALMIDPTLDPYVPSAFAHAVAERIGATILTLDGRGHWWMWEDPARVAEGLVSFWESA